MDKKELCKRYNEGENFDFLFFWHSRSYLSNWYPIEFTIDNITYWCVEQYMMAEKARLFNDIEILNQIMESKNQKEIKSLGRKVHAFNEILWNNNKENIVFKGNLAKFSQNEILRNYIISTKDRILVEASPYDKIWGIGLSVDNDSGKIKNPNNWKGLNLLGFTLMKVREQLKNNEKIKNDFLRELKENI